MAKKTDKLITLRIAQRKPLASLEAHETYPVHVDGETYHPARKVPDGKGGLKVVPADTFQATEERAASLGELVEIVPDAAPAANA